MTSSSQSPPCKRTPARPSPEDERLRTSPIRLATTRTLVRSVAGIIGDPHGALAAVGDARRPPEKVVTDDGAADLLAQLDLRLVLLELAPAHQDAAALHAQGRAPLFPVVPLHERAIAEADRTATGDPRDLVARTP